MYQIVRSVGVMSSIRKEAPAGAAALLVAELFFKFHSFLLESIAFLATWYVFSWLVAHATAVIKNRVSIN